MEETKVVGHINLSAVMVEKRDVVWFFLMLFLLICVNGYRSYMEGEIIRETRIELKKDINKIDSLLIVKQIQNEEAGN